MFTPRLLITFGVFVMLGLPEGVLGTAWPSIRLSFDRPESALAQLLIGYTAGYLVSTSISGRGTERVGVEAMTRLGVLITAVGLAGYAVSPAWGVALVSAVVLGAGAGTVDAAINADVALHHGQRVMNLLHAAFGIGATLGPLFVTLLLKLDASWRIAYVALLAVEAVLLALLAPRRASTRASVEPDPTPVAPFTAPAARPGAALVGTLIFFALYVGSEVSVGQWSFSILTEERGVGDGAAGIAVAAYWGGLTVGRLLFGVIDDRIHPLALLRGSMALAVASGVWFSSEIAGSIVALPLMGLAFSGMFPAMILLTPGWLGRERVARAVGYQLAASSIGAIVASALMGVVARSAGLASVPVAILVVIIGLAIAFVATEWSARPDRSQTRRDSGSKGPRPGASG